MAKISKKKLTTAYIDYVPTKHQKFEIENFHFNEKINSFPDMSIFY